MSLSLDRVKELFRYVPEEGAIYWRDDLKSFHRPYAGKKAGGFCRSKNGYGRLIVRVDRQMQSVHRIIWLMHYGELPSGIIDHADGDTRNNRIENLRIATKAQNAANRGAPKTNPLGIKGVRKMGKRFAAKIRVNYREMYLGMFDTAEAASAAYAKAAKEHFGEFAKN